MARKGEVMTSNISKHESIHEKALSRAKIFHRAEADLLDVLQELDEAKTFLHYRCTSLYEYCVKILKLSDDNAYAFIRVARKAKEVPELKEAVRKQEITTSKAKRIASVISKSNSEHWLNLAKTLPKPQLEKEVAKVSPKEATPEKAKYVSEDRVNLNMSLSEKSMKKFRRVQDLVSQSRRRHSSLEDSLDELLDFYLERKDPVEKAKRNLKSEKIGAQRYDVPKASPCPGHGRKPLPAQTKHQVNLRDQGQCTHIEDGRRCESCRWLDIHHQIPLSRGGSDEIDNLTTLCWAHHRMEHVGLHH
jgi:5-methylcytosine-specific restriction endonuclease McrA